MTSLPEQFQAARQTQLDRQFSILRALGDGVLDRTSRLVALNLDLSRATVEHSSNTLRQLLALRDPRDLLTIGAQSQRQLRTVFDYGHELFNIAAGLRGAALQTYSAEAAVTAPALAAPADIVAPAAEAVKDSVAQTVSASATLADTVADAVSDAVADTASAAVAEPVAEPAATPAASPAASPATDAAPFPVSAADIAVAAVPIVTSDIAPPVEPTPIARAASDILDVPLAPHPVAASVPVDVDVEIELPKVEPIEATPPIQPPANGAPKITEIRSGRGRKKNS